MNDAMKQTIQSILPEITKLRHELHRHPEIRFEEKWTSDRIVQFLEKEEIPHTRGHAKGTGVVACIEGNGTKTVALRADIDALEIEEETGLPYESTIAQRMHACGHDGHTANLCGVAKTLFQHKESVQGTVKCIFQPAEEIGGGGKCVVEEGLLDDVDAVFGLHCWPELPLGTVGLRPGPAMASADMFKIVVRGTGCHGADPGAGVDPVMVACYITTALQTMVSREINPWDPAVMTVSQIHGGFASNVIPGSATLEGTFRALKPHVREHLIEGLFRIAELTAKAHRAEAEVTLGDVPYPSLINDVAMTRFAADQARAVCGDGHVIEMPVPTMGAEDFSFYLEKVPGCFFFLGNNPSKTERYPSLHNPKFNFNDDALPYGIETMCTIATEFLGSA